MPVRRCALDDLEAVVEILEKKNRIVNVAWNGGAAVVVYEPRRNPAPPRETRGAAK